MPVMIIVAGPNGAGKTAFANELRTKLPLELVCIDADDIEAELKSKCRGSRRSTQGWSRRIDEDRSRCR